MVLRNMTQIAEAAKKRPLPTQAGEPPAHRPPGWQPQEPSTLRKAIYLTLAALFFLLGALGIILPGLPTTPFLLLTSFFLVRSSPRLNAALLRSKVFGSILTDWQVHGGVRKDVRVKSIVAVLIMVAATIYLSGYSPWATLGVLSLALVGITVILRLPSARER